MKKKYLLDTSIIAFLFRKAYNIGNRLRELDNDQCFVSEITIAELTYGAYHSDRVSENLMMIERLESLVDILPVSSAIDEYGKQKDLLVKSGRMIEDFDLLIGCTAVANGMIMVTDNTKHFSRIHGIQLENWVDRLKCVQRG